MERMTGMVTFDVMLHHGAVKGSSLHQGFKRRRFVLTPVTGEKSVIAAQDCFNLVFIN